MVMVSENDCPAHRNMVSHICYAGGVMILVGNKLQIHKCCFLVWIHFGLAFSVLHSHTKPYVWSIGRKFEKAKGRRNGCGFKVQESITAFELNSGT
ncbi:hypothetical protein AALP_AAs61543U000100 [Arabis alpina]|uniref:Large ribosomal subunit protein uL15/eL18 domain-containing protein n=1 Tax=Arabis alpina TaxID=50452 RepID=A0A087G0Q8_ARAAL|nr:hypothetical protein AALP_AAs61543U000100 [Arabis alpina]